MDNDYYKNKKKMKYISQERRRCRWIMIL